MNDKHIENLFNEYMDTKGPVVDDDTREWLHDAFLAGRQTMMPKPTEEAFECPSCGSFDAPAIGQCPHCGHVEGDKSQDEIMPYSEFIGTEFHHSERDYHDGI